MLTILEKKISIPSHLSSLKTDENTPVFHIRRPWFETCYSPFSKRFGLFGMLLTAEMKLNTMMRSKELPETFRNKIGAAHESGEEFKRCLNII